MTLIKTIFLSAMTFLFYISAGNSKAAVLFYDNCEDEPKAGTEYLYQGSWKNVYPSDAQGMISSSADYSRAGSKSYKIFSRALPRPNCVSGTACKHVQLCPIFNNNTVRFDYNTHYWIGFSVYLPNSWVWPTTGSVIDGTYEWLDFWDFHAVQDVPPRCDPAEQGITLIDTVSGASPNSNEKLKLRIQGDSRICIPAGDLNGERSPDFLFDRLAKGVWHDVVLNFKLDYRAQNIPFFKMWIDGQLIVSDTGINCTNDAKSPYFKFGVYGSTSNDQTLYYDEIRIGDGNSSYDEIRPRDISGK